jgi:AraC family transcriptional regulator of adaptative response / DNA-3-methyladenine glycosylase II
MTMSENRQTPASSRREPAWILITPHATAIGCVMLASTAISSRPKTTGTYRRPVCPADAAAGERDVLFHGGGGAGGGFAGLRCRPETAPDTGAWRGTSNTVSRALALIELGALDDGSVDALAGRLGLGERQLRRLCRKHLGASPVAVAQTHRVLLAKQLIHETFLPMTEIAFAAGFRSIRRFNETFLALFGRAPCALRRRNGPEISASPGGEISLLLRYQPPYDWPGMLEFLRLRAVPGIERVVESCYSRTIQLDGLQGIVSIRPGEDNALRARIRFPKLSALPVIIARLRRVFDLAADPLPISAHLAKDPALAPLVATRPGLRVPGAWDGFELAIRAVGQQITVPAAVRLAGRLVAAHGEPLAEPDRDLTHVFPRPEVLALANLTTLGMPRSRAATLSAVAAAVVADPDLFRASRGLDEAIHRLQSIRGIGEWTAHYIALRQMREPDAFPAADVGLMRALAGLEGHRRSSRESLAEPTAGGLGAPMPLSTSGLLSELRSSSRCAGARRSGIHRGGSNDKGLWWKTLWRRERRPATNDERSGICAGSRHRHAADEQYGRNARL